MNIKSIVTNTAAVERTQSTEITKEVRSENSSKDRDADGRRQHGEEPRKEHLTEDELQLAIKSLKDLDGVKKNDLIVELAQSGEIRVAIVKDKLGNIIRRIPERDLWALTQESSLKTGQLYNKAM